MQDGVPEESALSGGIVLWEYLKWTGVPNVEEVLVVKCISRAGNVEKRRVVPGGVFVTIQCYVLQSYFDQ